MGNVLAICDTKKWGEAGLCFPPFFEGLSGSVDAVSLSVKSLDGDLRKLEPSLRLVLARGWAIVEICDAQKMGGKGACVPPIFQGLFGECWCGFIVGEVIRWGLEEIGAKFEAGFGARWGNVLEIFGNQKWGESGLVFPPSFGSFFESVHPLFDFVIEKRCLVWCCKSLR